MINALCDRKWLLALACLGLLFALVGCATLSREECLRGDWYQIGLQDGQQGHLLSRLDDHRRACRDTPAIIDEDAYQAGRNIGLQSYCTPVSGYRVAANGDAYGNVCPVASEVSFLQGYVLGEQVHRAEQDIDEAERRVRDLQSRLDEKQKEIEEAQARANAAEGRDAIRHAEQVLWILRNEADDLRADLYDVRLDVSRARSAFRDVQERTSWQLQSLVGE
ncbi:MAG: DUF2799 domain-containing protein [Rhizobiales bacterium]|nr:DUF2799 domain-containing protein [Hyphomicrobiales bacterium]MBO6700634.1 DUF2799 domain-containing protein [Hyphomicrobiales bacterium]MBO6738170.1 DUF2799 domain-containing protein [Hyphomicrobiales bacterium]MBO6913523.1 DUF2799 domain-containing protein [Hyphomicrobiales bacterium]MBO6955308.1 DUF2799 domain-containing protein [Hyphomicrobiales bacterium]